MHRYYIPQLKHGGFVAEDLIKGWLRGRFEWQTGFAAFTYSHSHLDTVANYIKNQEKHHARLTFREEYLRFLKRFNIPYDERYVFEDDERYVFEDDTPSVT